ncbi:M23 family metallopeptidase [Culicoidibacter larvae]|uniref:M23 family metallopeptidase n=2 Tax=Culicoidibacter larvae TaxID=2579976 RepID=A0A5R8Q6P3_9FIRM|nr:M23 family metallopeptidase [Culicoidibacter larvae]
MGPGFLYFCEGKTSFNASYAKDYEVKMGGNYGDPDYVEHVFQYYEMPTASNHGFIIPTARNTMNERYGTVEDPIRGGTRMHNGIDLACSKDEAAWSIADGVVTDATFSSSYGYFVEVDHQNGYSSLYAHFNTLAVRAGDRVSSGQVVGYCGDTGFSAGYHLHLEIRLNGVRVDPEGYLPKLERSSIVTP